MDYKKPGVDVIKNIPYGPHGVRQQLDIYRPEVIPEGGCPVVFQIHAELSPFFVLHGTLDSLAQLNDCRVFVEKLRETSNGPVAYAELPGTEHAWEAIHSLRTEHTLNTVHRFLEWSLAEFRDEQPD